MTVENAEQELETAVAAEPVVEETPPSENGLPEEYNEALADYVEENAEPEEEPETTEAVGSEENSAPAPRQPTEWDTLRTEAKTLGINVNGMKKGSVQEEVEFQRERRSTLQQTAKDRFGYSQEYLDQYGTDELEKNLAWSDATLINQNRRQQPATEQQQQESPPPQTPPAQQQPEVPPGDVYAKLAEDYDADDPAVQALNQQQQQIQQLMAQQQEYDQRYAQQEQAQQQEQWASHQREFMNCVDNLGLPDVFGQEGNTSDEQVRSMYRLYETYGALYNATDGQGDIQDLVNRAAAAEFSDAIYQKRQNDREARARTQASTRMGSTAGTSRKSAPPAPVDDDDEYGPNGEFSKLHAQYNGFESANGSR